MTPIDGTSEEVKCEDLVKITIEDDPENFFKLDPNYLIKKGRNW